MALSRMVDRLRCFVLAGLLIEVAVDGLYRFQFFRIRNEYWKVFLLRFATASRFEGLSLAWRRGVRSLGFEGRLGQGKAVWMLCLSLESELWGCSLPSVRDDLSVDQSIGLQQWRREGQTSTRAIAIEEV